MVSRARAFWTSFAASLGVIAGLVWVTSLLGPFESGNLIIGAYVALALVSVLVANTWAGPWAAAGAAAAWGGVLLVLALIAYWVLRSLNGAW